MFFILLKDLMIEKFKDFTARKLKFPLFLIGFIIS